MPTVSRGLVRWIFWRGATIEDFADRLNHFWTFGLLILLASIISWKQGAYKPIKCDCDIDSESYCEFIDSICWSSHAIQTERLTKLAMEKLGISYDEYRPPTIPIVGSENVLKNADILTKTATGLTVYQWLPLILCFQALLFKLPNMLMYILHGYSGISFDKIAGLTEGYGNLNLTERDILSKKTARYLYNWCKPFENFIPWRCLTLLWFIVKFLFCVNIIVQVCILDGYLKTTSPPDDNSTSYGNAIADNILGNNATLWRQSPAFPRQVHCLVGEPGRHPNREFCNLPMNAFNEFIFMFLWVWLIVVAVVTCLSLLVWLSRTLIPMVRSRYIFRTLALADDFDITEYDVTKFANLVGEDGIVVFKLISANSSELFVHDVVCAMWGMYTGEEIGGTGQSRAPVVSVHVPKITVQEVVDRPANDKM